MYSLFGVRLLLFFFQNLSRPISMKGKISLNTIGKQRKKQGRLYAAEEKEREENGGSYTENMILQEIFIRQGIYFQPDFLKKTAVEGERPIVAVGFEDIYFPSRFQKEKFQRFMQELKKTGVKYFFFTNQNRESAFSIGKQTGIVKEKREVIDRKQFLLLKNVALEKQIKSIRIYCGLSEVEKSQNLSFPFLGIFKKFLPDILCSIYYWKRNCRRRIPQMVSEKIEK